MSLNLIVNPEAIKKEIKETYKFDLFRYEITFKLAFGLKSAW